jgi:hypothetical protein
MSIYSHLVAQFSPCSLELPLTFFLPSQVFKKGVYSNLYFTINNPDTDGRLVSSIIMLLQYNIAQNIMLKKRPTISLFRIEKGLLKG